jgi:hypothetical protein
MKKKYDATADLCCFAWFFYQGGIACRLNVDLVAAGRRVGDRMMTGPPGSLIDTLYKHTSLHIPSDRCWLARNHRVLIKKI